jgi:oxalate decarboxylase
LQSHDEVDAGRRHDRRALADVGASRQDAGGNTKKTNDRGIGPMTDFSRRGVIGGGAALAGGLAVLGGQAAAQTAPAATGTEGTGLAPPSATFPSFRFPLGEIAAQKVYPGGWRKEANAKNFPPSVAFAGVLMELKPGGLRELHWHANAAEWAYVIDGNCRITVIDPGGKSEVLTLAAGDVWFFPRGHGHSIEGLGPAGTTFVLVFDDGAFSEFATFSITDWLAHTPVEVLAKNLGVPASTFANFPKEEVYISLGAAPGPMPWPPAPGSLDTPPLTHGYHLLGQEPRRYKGGTVRLVSEKEFPISTTMTGALITLEPGALREMHWHPNADEWQLYLAGTGRMTVFGSAGRASTDRFVKLDVGYVPRGCGHYIENVGDDELQVLLVLNSGTYEEISLAQWLAANPAALRANNFSVPESTFDAMPKGEVFIAG